MRYNEITLCAEKFNTKEEFENAIKDTVMLLLKCGYIMTVRYDEPNLGIVVICFNHDNQSYGNAYPYWLSPEEIESVAWEDEDEE